MKRKLTLLLTAFLLLSGISSWGQLRTEASIDFSEQGYTNGQDMDGFVIDIDENVTIVFNKASGNNPPKYYNTGTAIRVYAGNNFVVSSTETISSITLTFGSGENNTNEITTDVGSFESPTWTGSGSEVTFTIEGTSGHRRIKAVSVTYGDGGQQQNVATPTFTPAAGTYYEAQTVSITCATDSATIYYNTISENGPWTAYTAAITVGESMTIWAYAAKEGYTDSPVVSATYTIADAPSIITIAEARALANDEYALVQGVVTFIDGKNVYIQDETAAIDLFLNSNAPSTLALGDLVQAYGKRALYKGLVELSNIDPNNAEQFSVISTGNELPLAVKTIAEILASSDAEGNLQATRVKVESATIGAINPSNNTPLTQDEATINIYKVPALTDIEEGDVVDVISIIGYYNAPQLRVALASDVVLSETPVIPDPQLTVSVSELSGFDYVYGSGPSGIQSFELDGENLTNNVTVIPSENFEVSILSDDLFQPENPILIYTPESGSISDFMIYVRLKAGLEVGTYNEQIAIASEGADTLYVSVTGTVTGDGPTPPPTPTGDYIRISDLSQLTEGSFVVFAARFDESTTDYYAMRNASSGKPEGVPFISATVDENEVLPDSIVDNESDYYWMVGVTDNGYTFTNANGELIGYTSSTNFATGGDNTEWAITIQTSEAGAMVPNYTGFVVANVNNPLRAFALNGNHNFGPYHTQNMGGANYNFYLDLFVKTEGGVPPTPTPTVATPTFTPAAGTYYEAQEVTISCTTDDATIYYSTVSANGPWAVYTEAITVEESMTIWAYAEKEGYNNSDIAEAAYTIQLGAVTVFTQDWEGEMNGWTFVTVVGDMPWNVSQYQGNHYAYANGYNGGVNEQWCISPGFNMHDYDNVILSFRNAKNYTGPDLELKYSTNYDGVDPTTASWWTYDFNMSPGSYTWVESGDISISITPYPAHDCYIAFKYTSTETEAAAWEVDDITLIGFTTVPNLTVTPNSLSGFTHVVGEGPSDPQSFTLSGVNIGPAPGGGSTGSVIIQSMENEFEISFDNEEFTWQLYIDDIAGTLDPTLIYVRMNGAEVGQYSGVINIHSSSTDQATVSLSGTVTEPPVPGDDYVRISDVSQLVDGNKVILASRYNETSNAYLAITNTLTNGKLGTTEFTSQMDGDDEVIPETLTSNEDDYYWTVGITADGYTFTKANGDMIGYGSSGTNFVINGDRTVWNIDRGLSDTASMVPEYTGFTIINATSDNRAFAVRYYNEDYICGAYSTSNISNSNAGEYNYFLDIFMQGEGGIPPTPTVAAPTFTPEGSTYYEAQEVSINCATADATIYYSLVPEPYDWIEYEGPIAVDSSMTICAYATKEGCNDSPIVCEEYIIEDDLVIIFNQDWEDGWQGWTEYCETGDSLWHIGSYQGNHYAYANGYNHDPSIDWLISPAFDLDSYSDVVLTFRTALNYNGPAIEILFSNDYDGQDPTTATWEPLECELSAGSWNWVTGEINLSEFSGTNCYIAFRYTCTEDGAAAWEIDDIMLYSGSVSTDPYLIATPNTLSGFSHVVGQGPSEPQTFVLTGGNFLPLPGGGYGGVTFVIYNGFEMSLDGVEYTNNSLYIELDETLTLDTLVYVRLWGEEVGSYGSYIFIEESSGISTTVDLSGTVLSEYGPSISIDDLPHFIQGNNGSNNNRVPVATCVWLQYLEPNTTYRYTNQFVDENDGPETAGAGNVIYANLEGFYRSTSPSLATEGGYGEFTTDWDGNAVVWFINEPTANARFTPGNHVYLRIRLNDGHDGTTVEHIFTTENYATVINFGTEHDANQGTAFYVKSNESPMTFAQLFTGYMDPQNPDTRPIYSTIVETTGVDFGGINQYADFYKDEVAGKDGWFGGILPNDNEYGINKILVFDITHYWFQDYYSDEYDGQWYPDANTVNPNAGLDEPIFIDLTDDGVEETDETNVKVWSTDHEFVIENGNNTHYTMTVYNLLGQPMMQQQINAGSTERISHSLATGVYVISLQNNQKKVSVKVVVK